jgi:hypothetical protein
VICWPDDLESASGPEEPWNCEDTRGKSSSIRLPTRGGFTTSTSANARHPLGILRLHSPLSQ